MADLAEEFRTKGAAELGAVLDAAQVEAIRAAFDALLDRGVVGPYATIVHDSWRHSKVVAELAVQVGERACAALGLRELVLFHDHLLWKAPGGEDMDWHQDYSYLPVDRADGLTLWVALDEVTEENGCLFYLFGTHVEGERRASWGLRGEDDMRAGLPPIEVTEGEEGVPAPAPAGHAIAHHANLWHRSPANRSTGVRRTWLLSFVAPEARWSPRHAPHPRNAVEPREEGQALEADLLRVRVG